MEAFDLAQIRECVAHGDRMTALQALRAAIRQQKIVPRDGIELMLAVRRGSPEVAAEAIDAMKWGVSGAYRYIPKVDYAVA